MVRLVILRYFIIYYNKNTADYFGSSSVATADASKRTIERRTEVLGHVRQLASGGDISAQFAAEIKVLNKAEREDLLHQAQLPVVIPANHALAMKADLGIPWNKLRILRR